MPFTVCRELWAVISVLRMEWGYSSLRTACLAHSLPFLCQRFRGFLVLEDPLHHRLDQQQVPQRDGGHNPEQLVHDQSRAVRATPQAGCSEGTGAQVQNARRPPCYRGVPRRSSD